MKKLLTAALLFTNASSLAFAQADQAIDRSLFMPPMTESHSYTYAVDEEGNAQAWLRIDSLQQSKSPLTYILTLPENTSGDVHAWYRENGCLEYKNDTCMYYGSTQWQELALDRNDRKVTLNVPAAKFPGKYNENNSAIGVSFEVKDATTKHWWGRTVNIDSAASSEFVSYMNIGVYLPDGILARDKSTSPANWAAGLTETMNSAQSRPVGLAFDKAETSMLDMAGSGQLYKNRQNLAPGKSYSFSFMSSTSLWKLFYPEIGFAVLWIAAIGAVIALLLSLIIGRKPLKWYFAVVGLLVVLGVLVGGLWFTYHSAFGMNGGNYPIPYYGGMGGGGYEKGMEVMSEPAVLEAPPVEDAMMETEVAPMTLETPAEPAQ